MSTYHESVLLQETAELLAPREGEVVVDATCGGGGHAALLAQMIGGKGTILMIDADKAAIEESKERTRGIACKKIFVVGNFGDMKSILEHNQIRKVHRVLFDLGVSSRQLTDATRGFSFAKEGPLRMTLGQSNTITAGDVVNTWSEKSLREIIHDLGEERFAGRIAREIVRAREEGQIQTTTELANIIAAAIPARARAASKLHPATKTFQAIRIAVNAELSALSRGLSQVWGALEGRGRVAVMSYHSLEDRITKRFMLEKEKASEGKRVTKKPVTPTAEEVACNRSSRSAKLRVIEKL